MGQPLVVKFLGTRRIDVRNCYAEGARSWLNCFVVIAEKSSPCNLLSFHLTIRLIALIVGCGAT
jgi:hypothetical protein